MFSQLNGLKFNTILLNVEMLSYTDYVLLTEPLLVQFCVSSLGYGVSDLENKNASLSRLSSRESSVTAVVG